MRKDLLYAAAMLLLGNLMTLGAGAQARTPLNAEGDAGAPLKAREAGERLRAAQLALQSRFYSADGQYDYAAMTPSPEWKRYRAEAARLRAADLSDLTTDAARAAFWINVYNALVTDGVVSLKVRSSVLKSPRFFDRVAYNVGGQTFTLSEIEHGLLRRNRTAIGLAAPVFKPDDPRLALAVETVDPRIHFALNCGARSCPPIRVYEEAQLDAQLDRAAGSFVNGPDVRVDAAKRRVQLSPLFQWYQQDFGPDKSDVLRFVARYLRDPAKKSFLTENADKVTVAWLPYDWALNAKP